MWRALGWTALGGGVVALILALRALGRSESGPYGDVPRQFRPPVPPEWKWTYRAIALLWALAGVALVQLASHLLPNVGWLARVRIGRGGPAIPSGWLQSPTARFGAAVHGAWDSVVGRVSGWFGSLAGMAVVLAHSLSRWLSHWFAWDIIFCLVAAIALEVRYEYYRSNNPKVAQTDRYWASRGLYRTASALQLAVRLWLAGLIPALLARRGWPGDDAFYRLMLGCSAIAAVGVALWYRRKPLYDLFVSYKSHDARLVREVADRLIAGGTRVWLAEYEIPLRREARFLRYIGYGIRRSRFGLAFTHDRYAKSPYCREEMEGLLRSCGPRKILRVRLADDDPADSAFQGIEQAPTLQTEGDVEEILAFVERQTGLKAAKPLPALFTPTTFQGQWGERPYHLDTTGWETAKHEGPNRVIGPTLHYIDGPPHLLFNLDIRAEDSTSARIRGSADDREMYQELKRYVPEFLGELKTEARGVHLCFQGGLSQMAVTYPVGDSWRRKYSVILPDPRGGPAAEFMFTFGFLGPFQGLCQRTPVMERLVQSLTWSEGL